MKPSTTPPIIIVSSTSPTPLPEVPTIPGYSIKEISDLSDTEVILELDHLYSSGPPSDFQNSATPLCIAVFGAHSTISAYKQENTILRIYLPRGEEDSEDGEYVAIRLISSGLSIDGLFNAAKDAWALYRDDEGVVEELLVKFPHPTAAATAAVAGTNEDEEKKGVEEELIRVIRGEEEGWTKFLVEVNDWKGWVEEEVKREDGESESGQLHVKVQVVLK